MGYEFQVTVDCNDPHTQARWWAEALEWRVEPSDENFIRGLVEAGHAREEDTEIFDGTLVWRAGSAITDPDHPLRPRMLFQRVPEGKTVKNRVHLDIQAGDNREAVAERLVAAGARCCIAAVSPYEWITMADPEGNEFCLC